MASQNNSTSPGSAASKAANGPVRLDVKRELLNAAFARMPLNMVMTVAAILLFIAVWWTTFPPPVLLGWGAAILLFNVVIRYWMWRGFCHAPVTTAVNVWESRYFAQTLFAGFAWGLGPALMMREPVEAQSALLVAILFAVCVVAINTPVSYTHLDVYKRQLGYLVA